MPTIGKTISEIQLMSKGLGLKALKIGYPQPALGVSSIIEVMAMSIYTLVMSKELV